MVFNSLDLKFQGIIVVCPSLSSQRNQLFNLKIDFKEECVSHQMFLLPYVLSLVN